MLLTKGTCWIPVPPYKRDTLSISACRTLIKDSAPIYYLNTLAVTTGEAPASHVWASQSDACISHINWREREGLEMHQKNPHLCSQKRPRGNQGNSAPVK